MRRFVIPSAARNLHLLLLLAASTAGAQTLAGRVKGVGDGQVSFHFAARPGVCGDGEAFIRTGRHQYYGSWNDHRGMEPCYEGPVQVRLTQQGGEITRVQYWVGPLRDRVARDLGEVPARDAAQYLMTIVRDAPGNAGSHAVMPAVIADSAVVWPQLLAIAKAGFHSSGVRRETMFWLSRYASGAIAGRPNDPLVEFDHGETEDEELKTQAVFVLSQLPRGEGIPQLIQVAKENRNWRVRSQALFWLGQSSDSRVLPVFEAVLTSR